MKMKKKNWEIIIILIISLFALIIGAFAFNFLIAFIIVGLLNLIFFIPYFLKQKGKKKVKTKKKKQQIWKYILMIGFIFVILIIIGLSSFAYIIIKNAPEFTPDKLYQKEATILYSNDQRVITKIGEEIREKITYDDMPEVLINAVIATEDARFFQHSGFDLPRFIKASTGQLMGQNAGGASTLTMQLIKNHFTSTESKGIKGITRKFTDIYMAIFKVEKKYTKKEILEFYVNSNYLGGKDYGGAYGVEQASQLYFDKKTKELTLPEAALIAGLFQAPSSYDPFINPDKAEARKKTVLNLMERHGFINSEEKKEAEKIHVNDLLVVKEKPDGGEFVGIINTAVDEVMKLTNLDPFVVPMEIYTTFDLEKQQHINNVFNGELYKWENEVVDAGVAVLDVKSGEIVAVGAGRHKKNLKGFNLATDIEKHIGSTAKPLYDYGPGIEYNNWSTYYPFTDEPHSYTTGISIKNWDSKYQGLITLREALRISRNVPALKAFQSVNNKDIRNFVTSLGLNPEIESSKVHESHALGGYTGESPMSMAGAYAAFGNGGYYIEPHSVKKVILKDNKEEIVTKVKKVKVMSEATAYMISNVLLDSARWGLGTYWNANGVNYAAKTGTSNYPAEVFTKHKLPSNAINDFWIASYNPDYAFVQWYGYDFISAEYCNKFGSTHYRQLFQALAKGIYTKNKSFTKPKDVLSIEVELGTSPAMLPSEFTPKDMIKTELFKKGTEPTEVSSRFNTLENPSNLQVNQNDTNINITWDPIEQPESLNEDKLKAFYEKIFNDENSQTKYLKEHLNYNKKHLGELGYNVYIKTNEELKLLGFTKNNNYQITPTSGNVTYVVKSSYSIFKDNMSSGIETTIVQDTPTEELITSDLVGEKIITIKKGESFTDVTPSVNVLNNTENVTHLADITTIITEEETNNIVTEINTNETNIYIISYNIQYKTYEKTHTRTIIIIDENTIIE